MWFKPEKIVLSCGHGIGSSDLTAFDAALEHAGLIDFNLIALSSIIPRNTPVIAREAPKARFTGNGRFLPAVYCHFESAAENTMLAAAVGVGVPLKGEDSAGVVFRYAGQCSKAFAVSRVESMVKESFRRRGLARFEVQTIGIERAVTQGWSSVFACAAYCDEDLLSLLEG